MCPQTVIKCFLLRLNEKEDVSSYEDNEIYKILFLLTTNKSLDQISSLRLFRDRVYLFRGNIKNSVKIKYTKAQRYDYLVQTAVFLNAGKEEKLASLGSVPGDTKSVKAQIESLKDYTADVNDKYLEVEALNQRATGMVSDRPDSVAQVVKQPMAEVNKRWKSLLDGIGQRKVIS